MKKGSKIRCGGVYTIVVKNRRVPVRIIHRFANGEWLCVRKNGATMRVLPRVEQLLAPYDGAW